MKATAEKKQKELKVDKRGRVRFSYDGYRYEVTKNGIKVYNRVGRMCGSKSEEYKISTVNLSGGELKALAPKLVEAMILVEYFVGVNTAIKQYLGARLGA